MIIALDKNNNRIHIDETERKNDYYCPSCGKPLIIRKGEIRRHHFAHMASDNCTDSWSGSYDMTDWHFDWQSKYPKNNQEVLCTLGSINHRADVMIDRTVVEFQHSSMSTETFNNRNSFYDGLGYKVIWLFDLKDDYTNGQLSFRTENNEIAFEWVRPKKTFDLFDDIQYGTVDLFFQISDEQIVRVNRIDIEKGFKEFNALKIYTEKEFLEYTGLRNGICLPPDQSDVLQNEEYIAFKNKYNIELNPQQERAVQAVNGSNLILAVPGSGKTTILVSHIGYMIYCKKIPPENILAVSYNKKAAEEMKMRFLHKFGNEYKSRLEIGTINSLSQAIINYYASQRPNPPFDVIDDQTKSKLFHDIYRKTHEEYPLDSDIKEMEIAFTYIKNFMLTDDEIKACKFPIEKVYEMFRLYQEELTKRKKMDFDDQMVYAKRILEVNPKILEYYRSKFRYICVDEAQDTSKLQHALIKLLANGNNIFMVGDEDQSIYAFRAAYPQALLDFKNDYLNPYILRMENNYRSTDDIITTAGRFISRNRKRFKKVMKCTKGKGKPVERIECKTRSEQYKYLAEIAKQNDPDTAILYRNNDSMLPLVDLLIKNQIPYRTTIKDNMLFFSNRIVKDIEAFIDLAYDHFNTDAFETVAYKINCYLSKNDVKWIVNNCKRNKINILDAMIAQRENYGNKYKSSIDKAHSFKKVISVLPRLNAFDALTRIVDFGYGEYISDKNLDYSKVEVLLELSKNVTDLKSLKQRLREYTFAQQEEFMDVIDPYYTLVGYFNSIRELGGAVRLLQDDIPKRIYRIKNKYGLDKQRYLNHNVEITSRMSSYKIPEKLNQLETTCASRDCLDTAIATNMIAVGMDVDRLGLMVVTGQPKQNSEYIQATSRIGRAFPGLVVTLYNAYRPRDLSHYENFTGYHSQLYRFVEGTTATPFSARARDRVLHALIISAIRLNYPNMANNPDAAAIGSLSAEQIDSVKRLIIDRLNIIKPSARTDAEMEIDQFIDWWKLRAVQTKPLRYYVVGTEHYNRLMNPYDKPHEEDEKATLQSMREVESSANMFYYTEE